MRGVDATVKFATAEELIDHLATVGEDWSQNPMRRESAEALVRGGRCPSGVAVGGAFYANEEALVALDAAKDGLSLGGAPSVRRGKIRSATITNDEESK